MQERIDISLGLTQSPSGIRSLESKTSNSSMIEISFLMSKVAETNRTNQFLSGNVTAESTRNGE